MTKSDMGQRHRQMREEVLKMSVSDYAELLDVKESTVYSWESGRTWVPQEVIALLTRDHGVSAEWMLTGRGQEGGQGAGSHVTLDLVQKQVVELQKAIESIKRESPEVLAPARKGRLPRIPLLSLAVSAGAPTAADDVVEKEIDLAEMLLQHPESTYFIRVVGDSMTDAGISDGDTLIVDCALQPRSGQVVIAKVFGELTVKRYVLVNGHPLLRAENKRFKDIEITAEMDFSIVGVVSSCIKKL
jgi:DNA polymerase V